ncbi:MAG: hypothetical protein JSS09_01125, partial [Verrucomicrobia bacterium]|nr:hypothetical protein [Verrucomicrobiota bacterium]
PTLSILTAKDLMRSQYSTSHLSYSSPLDILEQYPIYMKSCHSIQTKDIKILPFYRMHNPPFLVIDVSECDLEATEFSSSKVESLIMHFASLVSQPLKLLKLLKPIEERLCQEIQQKGISFTQIDDPDFMIPMPGFFILGPPKEDPLLKSKDKMIDSLLLEAERAIGLNKDGSPTFVGFVDEDLANAFMMRGNTFKEDIRVSRMLLHGINTHRLTILAFMESLKGTEFEDLDSKTLLRVLLKTKISRDFSWSFLLDTADNMSKEDNPDSFDYNCNSPFILNSLILCFGNKLGLPNLTYCMRDSFWASAYEMVEKINKDSSSYVPKEFIYLMIMKELATLGPIYNVGQNFAFTLLPEIAAADPKYKDHPDNLPGIKLE